MISEPAQSASRLAETLEKLSEWAGSGVGGDGPSGPPSDEVVRAFEQALNGAPDAAAMPDMPAGDGNLPVAAPTAPGPAEAVPSIDGERSVFSSVDRPVTETMDARLPDEHPSVELTRLLDAVSGPGVQIGPEVLFRAQYLTGMLKVQTQAGLKTSQGMSEGMESVLRQQG